MNAPEGMIMVVHTKPLKTWLETERMDTSASRPDRRSGIDSRSDEKDVEQREEEVDEALEMTFPASDPPAWMG